ncbi:MAG: F0F1 ATP synthase subunit B [Flavobacteriaceae bacterium]
MATETPSDPTENTHATTEAGHGAAAQGTFPPFDPSTFPSQLLWLVITFALFYYLMAKVALPRMSQILESRHDRIATDLAEAERLKGETDEAIAAYEQALAEARDRASGIARTNRESVNAEIEAKRHEAEAELAERIADAEKRITATRQKAMAEVSGIASDATVAAVQAVAGMKITKAEADKAVAAS